MRAATYGKVVAQQTSIQCHAQGHCSTSAEWTSRRSNRGSAGSRGYSERQKCRRFPLQCEITACFLTRIVIAGLWEPNKKQMQQRDFIELVRDTEWKKRKEKRAEMELFLLHWPPETLAGHTTKLNVVEEDRLVQRQQQFRGGAGTKNKPSALSGNLSVWVNWRACGSLALFLSGRWLG